MEILKNLQLPKQMEAGASTENSSILRVTEFVSESHYTMFVSDWLYIAQARPSCFN